MERSNPFKAVWAWLAEKGVARIDYDETCESPRDVFDRQLGSLWAAALTESDGRRVIHLSAAGSYEEGPRKPFMRVTPEVWNGREYRVGLPLGGAAGTDPCRWVDIACGRAADAPGASTRAFSSREDAIRRRRRAEEDFVAILPNAINGLYLVAALAIVAWAAWQKGLGGILVGVITAVLLGLLAAQAAAAAGVVARACYRFVKRPDAPAP